VGRMEARPSWLGVAIAAVVVCSGGEVGARPLSIAL